MKSIDEIKKGIMDKANQEIAKAEKECNVREQLTIQPKFVHPYPLYRSAGSIMYEVNTKLEALAIINTFTVSPSFLCKCNVGTSVKCFDDETAKEVTEHYAGLHIERYHASIEFFTLIGSEFWRVSVRLPVHLFGTFYKSDPNAKLNYKKLFKPLPLTCELHCICKYAAPDYRGEHSFGEEIYAMYEPYELERQLTAEGPTP